jgi:hypothetical protein
MYGYFLENNLSTIPYYLDVPVYGYFFMEKMGPTYHITSVYQRMAIFWKKWVQGTILRVSVPTNGYSTSVYQRMAIFGKKICPLYSEVPHYVGVPVYGYFFEKTTKKEKKWLDVI